MLAWRMGELASLIDARGTPCRRIGLLAYEGVLLLNIAGPSEVFSAANRELARRFPDAEHPFYEVLALSPAGGLVGTSASIAIETSALPDLSVERFDTIAVAGGASVRAMSDNPQVLDWLRAGSARVARLAALGGGVLVLARAGLLDGRRCVAHWRNSGDIATEFPRVTVDQGALFVRDGHVLTAAGFTSSMDLALEIIQEDFGKALAVEIAQMLVVARIRSGEQPQLSAELRAQRATSPRIAKAAEWIVANVHKRPSVATIADRFAMSERNFSRSFTSAMGLSPKRFIEQVRLETARRWLASSDISMEMVAHCSGYSGGEHLAQTFKRSLGMSPMEYREQMHITAAPAHGEGTP